MLSEQIKELRLMGDGQAYKGEFTVATLLREAADTIEGLRDMLQNQAFALGMQDALGGGTCEVISHYYYDDYDIHEFEFSCGHSYTNHDDMPYPFCPMCGAKVKAVER